MLTTLLAAAILAAQPATAAHQPAQPASEQPVTPGAATPTPRPDAWWTERNDSLNARATQGHGQGDIGIIFLGDSITEHWAMEGKEVWDRTYAPRRAADFGIGGDRTQHLLYRVQNGNLDGLAHPAPRAEGAPSKPPALAVILIGTNNTSDNPDPAPDIAAGIAAIVKTVRTKLPDTPILLLAVFPRGDPTDPARATIKEVNTAIAKLADAAQPADASHPADAKVHYLDIGDKFLDSDGILQPDIMPDKLHLSAKGYQIWADAMEPTIKELLK